jgi:hypothetical protein
MAWDGLMRNMFAWAAAIMIVAAVMAGAFVYLSSGEDKSAIAVAEQRIDLTVSSNEVVSSNGTTVYQGSNFSEALDWALMQDGNATFVPAGVYNLSDSLTLANNVALVGAGDGPTGTVFNFTSHSGRNARVELLNVNNVTLKHFRVVGNGNVHIWSDKTVHGDYLMENITVYRTSVLQPGAFMTWTSHQGIIDNLTFLRCKAIETSDIGFALQGDGGDDLGISNGGWVRNVTFRDCVANYCGISERFNNWVCGFDLAEGTNVKNLYLVNCQASNNWLDGFHFEAKPSAINCVLKDCIANNNSQREPGLGADYRWDKEIQDVRLINSH